MSLASGNSILNLGIYGNSLVKAPTIIYGSEMRLLMLHNTIYNTDIMKTIELGEIILPNRIKITDPGYFPEEWCCNEANILPGIYKCEAIQKHCGNWGNRISELRIQHIDYPDVICMESFPWSVGVDSGQAGFFDAEDYENNSKSEEWYSKVCEITLHEPDCGSVNGIGVVASSGYGDGAYECIYGTDCSGNVVALQLIFINESVEVGDIVKWYDPAINNYPEEERELAKNRRFKVIGVNGEVVLIQEIDENGEIDLQGTEAEVFDSELEIIE